jgi:hypothetical protein
VANAPSCFANAATAINPYRRGRDALGASAPTGYWSADRGAAHRRIVVRRWTAGGREELSRSVTGFGQVTTIVAASAIRWSFDHGGPNVARGP